MNINQQNDGGLMSQLSMTFDSMQANNNNVRMEAENYLKQVSLSIILNLFHRFKPPKASVKLSFTWLLTLTR